MVTILPDLDFFNASVFNGVESVSALGGVSVFSAAVSVALSVAGIRRLEKFGSIRCNSAKGITSPTLYLLPAVVVTTVSATLFSGVILLPFSPPSELALIEGFSSSLEGDPALASEAPSTSSKKLISSPLTPQRRPSFCFKAMDSLFIKAMTPVYEPFLQ